MRLEQITLQNYRCFSDLTVQFHPELTVLIAPNGAGKTSILDAARVALWPFVNGFDLGSKTGKVASIQLNDVRLLNMTDGNMEPQIPCSISATGSFGPGNKNQTWIQTRKRMKPGTETLGDSTTKAITALGKEMEQRVRTPSDAAPLILPMMTYLGTSRLWYEGRFSSEAKDTTLDQSEYSRTSGYLNCLSYASSFKAFTAWYSWIYRSYRENQIDALERQTVLSETGQRFANTIEVVKTAVDALVTAATGWHSLEYSASHNQQLVMRHKTLGVMPVEMLSDGLRNTIAMVADLAFRASKLNPHLGAQAALLTPGIALIDEVDMFLHPSWQQTILGSLRKAFPKVQFIVTTHSPQVLSSIRRENIRVLGANSAEPPLAMTYGEPSGDVMYSVMHVDPQPPVREKKLLDKLTELVDEGRYDSARANKLFTLLNARLSENHPQLLRLQRNIRRMKALKR
jgi:predicted ATP-binding protein involved in virulence